jgi:recombination protein RecA
MPDDLRELAAKARGVAAAARTSWVQKGIQTALRQRIESAGAGSLGAPASDPGAELWGLDALRGRLVELSARGASATLTAAFDLILEAQQATEPVAWITLGNTTFYPPDAADSGVDLAALVVVRIHDAVAAARAAERLLRSGGFGLVVLDFGGGNTADIPVAHQGRLVTLAQSHAAAVVCITEKLDDAPSIGSLVSLHAAARRAPAAANDDAASACDAFARTEVTLRALKDKRRGPGWTRTLRQRGPSGV